MTLYPGDFDTGCGSYTCWRDKATADETDAHVADGASYGYPDWVVQCPLDWPQLPATCPAGLTLEAGSYGTGCGPTTCWTPKSAALSLEGLTDATPLGYPEWFVRCPLGQRI